MKRFCSIISCFLAITILISSSVVTVHAASVSPVTAPFWVWAGNKAQEEATSDEGYVGYLDYLKAAFSTKDSGCTSSQSKNGCHYWQLVSDLPVSSITGKFRVKCQYCGMYYADYSSCDPEKEAETAYTNNVSTLPATGYNSAGKLLWQPRWSDCLENRFGFNVCYGRADTLWIREGVENPFVYDASKDNLSAIFSDSEFLISRSGPDTISGWTQFNECDLIFRCNGSIYFEAPISGKYSVYRQAYLSAEAETGKNTNFYKSSLYSASNGGQWTLGQGGYLVDSIYFRFVSGNFTSSYEVGSILRLLGYRMNFRLSTPIYAIEPISDTTTINNTYNINTRVNNFQGDYYDNVTNNYYNNTTIINETTNNYYDMTTNNYYTMSNWSYDYQSRTYFVTLEDGTTITVQFGDDCLTITNNNVENSYQYVINNNNTPNPNPETPSTCKHNWTETIDVAPTCLEGGHANFTCSLCGETYEQILSAKGHNWTVKEHVNTVYGESGVIVTQGHTLYECSACGEQWYTETATPPPDVSGGSSIRSWLQAFQLWLDGKLDSLFSAADAVIVTKLDALIEKTSDTVVNVIGDNTYVPGVLYLDDDNGVVNTTKNGVSIFGDLLRWLWQNVFDGAFEAADITKLDGLFYDPTEVTTDGS